MFLKKIIGKNRTFISERPSHRDLVKEVDTLKTIREWKDNF